MGIRKQSLLLGCTLVLILNSTGVKSQQLGMYNLDYLPQRSYMNPAFSAHGKFNIGIPIISGFGYNYSNNGFRYSDVVKKKSNDSLYIDSENAIANLNTRNRIKFDSETELLSFGFKFGKNFFSFNATEKINLSFTYSKALIEFLYYGNAATMGTTQVLNPGAEGIHYREYGFSWARDLHKKLKGGIRVKYLYGMENISTKGNGVSIYTDPNDFSITASSDLTIYTSGVDSSSFGNGGFSSYAFGKNNTGMGVDLGLSYKPIPQIEISGSVLDIGSITFKSNNSVYSTSTKEGTFTYNGININEFVNNDTTSAEEYLSNLVDSLYTSFDVKTTHENYKYKLPTQMFFSASYLITPRYRINVLLRNKKFHSGNQTDYQISFTGKSKTWFNYTLGLNKINQSPSTLGAGFTINFKNDQIYFVSDNIPGLINWKKSYNTGFKAGINLMFGTKPKYMKPPQPLLNTTTSSK